MAEENNAALIRRIASVVGHELRNPMAVIKNSAYFVKAKLGQDGKLDPKVEKHLGIVDAEIGRADRLIGDILVYSRVMEAKPAEIALNAVVEAALAAVTVPEKIKVKKELAKSDPKAKADEKLVADAIRRFLDNAIDAMPEGGTLAVKTSASGKEVSVTVSDTGAGVKPDFAPLLFQPFATTKPRGLGLGLAMAKKIADANKGKVAGGSLKGGGASFTFSLPA